MSLHQGHISFRQTFNSRFRLRLLFGTERISFKSHRPDEVATTSGIDGASQEANMYVYSAWHDMYARSPGRR